jgi:DNA-binding MarR family transcriptional regulator
MVAWQQQLTYTGSMSTTTPAAASAKPPAADASPELMQIERGLSTIVRWGNLPRVRERFTAVAGMDLERASYAVLFRLEVEGPARLSDLAQRVGVDISTLSRQVHHLEAAGLVGRSVMEEDRRAALLSVTDEGRDFVHRIRAAKRAAITEMLEHWTPEERAELGRVLGRLANEMVAFGCRER